VALDLVGRSCIVVGAGHIASRKIQALLAAHAHVTVIAPRVSDRVTRQADKGQLVLVQRPFEPSDLDGAFLVLTATDDAAVNQRVADEARQRGVLVNSADDPPNCDFILPAVVRRGSVQIAITTGGRSPALARHLRQRIETLIPPAYEQLGQILAEVRLTLRREGVRVDAEAWQAAIDDQLIALVASGALTEATDLLITRLRNA
jgi:precorrin-2 dehydrogenase/sirohydrochlorin ferrochelatase